MNKQSNIQVKQESELLKFLIEQFPDKNRRKLKQLLTNNQIAVNHINITQYNHILKKGDTLVISWAKSNIKDFTKEIKLIYEDNSILVIEKSAKILSVANDKEKKKAVFNILIEKLKSENPKNQLYVTHRLDRGSSGLMVFAKSSKLQESLLSDWKNNAIRQSYFIVVEGYVKEQSATIKSYLKENSVNIMYSCPHYENGMLAITHFDLIKANKNYSLLQVRTETKRKNQIRVHFKEYHHPVAGDKKYGAKSNPMGRMAIHACSLTFSHPETGKLLSYTSELPEKFQKLFQ